LIIVFTKTLVKYVLDNKLLFQKLSIQKKLKKESKIIKNEDTLLVKTNIFVITFIAKQYNIKKQDIDFK
tara:strand:- start:345 stop:551 length:207 start_codon:yes stop_codon:yes gene_type:complete